MSLLCPAPANAAGTIYAGIGTCTSTTMSVGWTAVGVTDATEYRIYYGFSSTSLYSYVSCKVTDVSGTITGLSANTVYYVKVRAMLTGGLYTDSTVKMGQTQVSNSTVAPSAPSALTASATGTTTINLKWTDTSGNEQGFNIERSTSSTTGFAKVGTASAGATTWTDQSLTPNTIFYYRVTAYNAVGSSPYSNVASATTLDAPPLAPSDLSGVLVAQGQISLKWTDNSSNEVSFSVERSVSSTTGFAQIGSVGANSTTYLDTAVGTYSTYYYRVRSVNTSGGSYSNIASVSTVIAKPAAPSGLTAAPSADHIDLQWADNSSNETGFYIERASTSTGAFSQVGSVGTGVTTWANTGLSAGSTFYYRVCAYNSGGSSTYTNTVSATIPLNPPGAPSGLTATAVSISQINLQWTDGSNNETGFYVERSTDGVNFTQIISLAAGTTTWQSTGLTTGTTYYFRVRAYNNGGNSGYTNVASTKTLVTAPSAPTGLSATPFSAAQINLAWTDTSNNESGFYVERAPASGSFTQIASLGAGITSYQDTSVSGSTTYSYRVCAWNAGGNSTYSAVVSATTPAAPIPAPSGLTAVTVSATQISLAWVDNSSTETAFHIERSASATGGYTQVGTVGSNVTAWQDAGCSAGTTYFYRVHAYTAAVESPNSNVASATTLSAPAAPSGLAASGFSGTQINLTWIDNSSNEATFSVQRGAALAGPFTEIASLPANTTAYSDASLTPATTYYYKVCAVNSVGTACSNVASAATTASGPAAPTNLAATSPATNQVALTWSDNSNNETGFRIEKGSALAGPFTYLTSVGANVATYTDPYVVQGTTYYYRVCAYNTVANSNYTNVAQVTTQTGAPIAPNSLTAAASAGKIDLGWVDNSSNEKGFRVQRSSSSTGPFSQVADVVAGTIAWSDTSLPKNTTYYYQVCAYNDGGTSAFTNIASATTPDAVPADPASLTVSVVSPSQINIGWADKSDNEQSFKIERTCVQDSTRNYSTTVAANTTSWSDTGLSAPATYSYRVCAVNSAGSSGYATGASGSTVLPAPTGLQIPATNIWDSELDLSWTAVPANITGYRVEVSTSSTGPFSVAGKPSYTKTNFQNTGLSEDTVYYYRVYAYTDLGDSAYAEVNATTKLKAPTALIATNISDTEIDLKWTDNSLKEAHFVLERSVANGPFAQLVVLPANTVSYSDTTCLPNTAYAYRVMATGSISDYSNTLNVQTKARLTPVPALTGFLSDIGTVRDVVVSGTKAYLTSDPFGLVIVDISNPSAPTVLGSQHPGGSAVRVAVGGSVAIAAGTPRGTDVIDISNPSLPKVAAFVPGTSADAAISGSLAVVAAMGDVQLLDVSNPYSPVALGTISTPASAYGVAVSGNIVAICDSTRGLLVVDITNPRSPVTLGTCTLGGSAWKVTISGSYAYVTNNGLGQLQVVDLSVPSVPRLAASVTPTYGASNLSVSGNRVYVCAGGSGMSVYDVSNPNSPVVAAVYASSDVRTTPVGASEQNGVTVIAGSTCGLQTFDMRNLAAPTVLGSLTQRSISTRVAATDQIILAAGTPRGTDVIDISNPSFPKVAASVPGTSVDAAISGSLAVVAAMGDVQLLDVSNPYSPVALSTISTPASAYGVAVSGNIVAICDSTRGLQVVDITNPRSPVTLGTCTLGGSAWKVTISGSYAYVTNNGLGQLQVVDLSVPSVPRLAASVTPTYGASNVSVSGGKAYVCGGGLGMSVYDVTNPVSPILIADLANSVVRTTPMFCAVQDGIAFISGTGTGVSVVDMTDPRNPIFCGYYKAIGDCSQLVLTAGGQMVTTDSKSEVGVFSL